MSVSRSLVYVSIRARVYCFLCFPFSTIHQPIDSHFHENEEETEKTKQPRTHTKIRNTLIYLLCVSLLLLMQI